MTSTLPPFIQAVSGALGSAVANATSYPLDLVCTRLQTSQKKEKQGIRTAYESLKEILRTHGISGLYSGIETDTAATVLSSFLYFYAYSYFRSLVIRRKSSTASATSKKVAAVLSVTEEIGVGFLAGIASRTVTTPLSLITVRLQNGKSSQDSDSEDALHHNEGSSVSSVVRDIYRESGLAGFWRGFETTALLCFNPAFTMFFYQLFRRLFLRGKDREMPAPHQAFLGAAFANVLAVTLLYPLILAKTRIQASRNRSRNRLSSMLDVWKTALSQDGLSGLYQGLEAQLAKGFLNQGIAMMTKQRIEALIVAMYLRSLHGKSNVR